MYLDNAEV